MMFLQIKKEKKIDNDLSMFLLPKSSKVINNLGYLPPKHINYYVKRILFLMTSL